MTAIAVRQGSPQWVEARRSLVTATDLPVLLGISPWRCEADLADEKLGLAEPVESTARMRMGTALEPLALELYAEQTGRVAVRSPGLTMHPAIPWAAASLDATAGDRVVEVKYTASRSRFADGVPQDVQAQVAWQLGVSGLPVADIAVLTDGGLTVHEQAADPALFADLVALAEDFRRRLDSGGPFARNDERIRREFPADDGVMLPATPDLVEMARQLADARADLKAAEAREKTVASALRAVLLGSSGVEGVLTYRKSADSTRVNWPAVASAYRELLSDRDPAELDALVSIHSENRIGPRVLRLSRETTE